MDHRTSPAPTATEPAAESSLLARVASIVFSAFGWLMCTLAVGAVAAFVSLVAGIRPSWLVLLLAIPLTIVLKLCGCLQTRWSPAIAAAAIVLAGFYAACLTAIARLAAATGFSFGAAFKTGGVGLTVQAARLGLDVISILIYAAAIVVAAVLAAWLARNASATNAGG